MRQKHYFQMIDCRMLAAFVATVSAFHCNTVFAQQLENPVVGSGVGTKAITLSDDSYQPGGGPGLIIIARDYGPRNALTPEVGRADTVNVSPGELTTAFDGVFDPLTDGQVAEINSGGRATLATQSAIQAPLDILAGNDNIRAENAGGVGGAGGIGGIVSDAIGQSMGALTSALAGLNQ